VYLEGTEIEVDVDAITVGCYLVFVPLAPSTLTIRSTQQTLGVRCTTARIMPGCAPDSLTPQYDAAVVRQVMEEILAQ